MLYVPGLAAAVLNFAGPANVGADAIVAGYPENNPFTAVPARIDLDQAANAPDIYQAHIVKRQIYSVRALVQPGNSGGPLLAPDGQVYGVVFAAAVGQNDTGFALTASEVTSDAQAAHSATAAVSTQGCA